MKYVALVVVLACSFVSAANTSWVKRASALKTPVIAHTQPSTTARALPTVIGGVSRRNALAATDIGLPTQLAFDSHLTYWMYGGVASTLRVDFNVKSLVLLSGLCMPSLVSPNTCNFSKLESPMLTSGSLCKYENTDYTCSCTVTQGAAGNFTLVDLAISNTNTAKPSANLVYKLDALSASADFDCVNNRTGQKKKGSVPLFNPLKPGEALFNVAYDLFHSSDADRQAPGTYHLSDWTFNADKKSDPFTYASKTWAGGEKAIVPGIYVCYEADTRIALKQF